MFVPPPARPPLVRGAGRPPVRVIGAGTAASCTQRALAAAIARGGTITFHCGPAPVTIRIRGTLALDNRVPRVSLRGGGRVTLEGDGHHRILYLDTCDPRETFTTSHCQDQATPVLAISGITFRDGNATGQGFDGGGGGAVFDRGGQLSISDSAFVDNVCDRFGPDVGGGAVRALSQYANRPVRITGSRFLANRCSNGGALSSIGVSWTLIRDGFSDNRAIGFGANPAQPGTPGGGSGGAIYTDGDRYTLSLSHCLITQNHAREGGGAIIFVSDDRTGTLRITDSRLAGNPSGRFETAGLPGIFYLGHGPAQVHDSTLRR